MKKKNLIFVAVLMISAALAFNASLAIAKDMTGKDFIEEARESIGVVDVAAAKAIFDKGGTLFLDVRTEREFKSGHIPGAMHIPRGLLEFKIGSNVPDKNKEIVVYCKTGGRASLATATLVKMGYKNVKNLDGGWKAWLKAGNPVE